MSYFLHKLLVTCVFLVAFSVSGRLLAQVAPPAEEKETIYTVVEELPLYPGGDQAMYAFIREHLKYPEEAKKNGTEGRVFVSFVLDKQGKIISSRIEKSLSPGIDAEALRVVQLLEGWTPAKMRGEPVLYRFVMPITFRMN